MDKNLQNIEDLFRDSLEDNEERPSPTVWKEIDNVLDKDKVSSIKQRYAALKRVTFLLLFLLAVLSIYEFTKSRNLNGLAKTQEEGQSRGIVYDKDPTSLLPAEIASTSNQASRQSILRKSKKGMIAAAMARNKSHSTDNISYQATNKFPRYFADHSGQRNKWGDAKKLTDGKQNERAGYLSGQEEGEQKIAIDTYRRPGGTSESIGSNNLTTSLSLFHAPIAEATERDVRSTDKIIEANMAMADPKLISLPHAQKSSAGRQKGHKPAASRFSGTVFFSPDFASYHLEDDKPGSQPENAIKIGKSERHDFSSTSGVLIDYKLNDHWIVQSGLTFSNTNITADPKTIYAQADLNGNIKYRLNTSSGYGYLLPSFVNFPSVGDSLTAISLAHVLNYISVPTALKYRIKGGKLSLNVTTGFTTNILIKGMVETTVEKGPRNETEVINNLEGLKTIYFSGLAGLTADYKLTKKLSLTFAPTLRLALNSINKDAPVRSYPNTIMLAVGLKTRF